MVWWRHHPDLQSARASWCAGSLPSTLRRWDGEFSFMMHIFTVQPQLWSMTAIHSITFHVIVRCVTVELCQKAVALPVAGHVVRVCGENISAVASFQGRTAWIMCRFSSGKVDMTSLILTFPVVTKRHLLSKSVVANTKHCLLHAVWKHPLQVVCVCGGRKIQFLKSQQRGQQCHHSLEVVGCYKMKLSDLRTVQPVAMTAKWRCARCGPESWREALDILDHLRKRKRSHNIKRVQTNRYIA